MPPLDSLDEASDYSGFLSPGVSDHLHRLALRKLFQSTVFQVRDGLDDYDRDYRQLQTLPRVLADALSRQDGSEHPDRMPDPPATDTPPAEQVSAVDSASGSAAAEPDAEDWA